MIGGPGDDVVIGGRGIDLLIGGPGADDFRFPEEQGLLPQNFTPFSGSGAGNRDVILDFQPNHDLIHGHPLSFFADRARIEGDSLILDFGRDGEIELVGIRHVPGSDGHLMGC